MKSPLAFKKHTHFLTRLLLKNIYGKVLWKTHSWPWNVAAAIVFSLVMLDQNLMLLFWCWTVKTNIWVFCVRNENTVPVDLQACGEATFSLIRKFNMQMAKSLVPPSGKSLYNDLTQFSINICENKRQLIFVSKDQYAIRANLHVKSTLGFGLFKCWGQGVAVIMRVRVSIQGVYVCQVRQTPVLLMRTER